MVKQSIYFDTASTLLDLVNFGNNRLRINVNGLLNDIPPYALLRLCQLEFIAPGDLSDGVIMKFAGDSSNHMNLNKNDSVLAICQFDYTKGTKYHYKQPEHSCQLQIAGNIQQLEFYFTDSSNQIIDLTDVLFACVIEVETPDVGEPVREYRKAIPL